MDELDENKFKLHSCELQPTGVAIIYDKALDKNNSTWRLEISRQVTEADLEENHNFETL